MKFSVFFNNKQANNVNGYPSMSKDSDYDDHRFTTYKDAFYYAGKWLKLAHGKTFDLGKTLASYGMSLPRDGYHSCLNEGKVLFQYNGSDVIEIRREEEGK